MNRSMFRSTHLQKRTASVGRTQRTEICMTISRSALGTRKTTLNISCLTYYSTISGIRAGTSNGTDRINLREEIAGCNGFRKHGAAPSA